MPHRKITVEHIEHEADPERKWRLAKSVWFHHAQRGAVLKAMLDRILNPTSTNQNVYVESHYLNDVPGLQRQIAFHERESKTFGDLWALYAT